MTLAQQKALDAVGSKIDPNRCLRYTRQWFGVGPKYATAIQAWEEAEFRHPGEHPPRGAVVPVWFFSDDPARHVAIHLADGSVVTVNGTTVSKFKSIEATARAGFGPYLGWAEDLNGERVYEFQGAQTSPDVAIAPTEQKKEEEIVIILRTKQHGIYTVAPGLVVTHTSTSVTDGISFRQWPGAVVWDIAPEHLAEFIFALSGCTENEIPAPGSVWALKKD